MPMVPSDMEAFRRHMSTYVKPVRPDFNKLRGERNAAFEKMITDILERQSWNRSEVFIHGPHPEACFCACGSTPEGSKPICEHVWNGKDIDIMGGFSSTCGRCGMPAITHAMRYGP